jgi:hypothetical protein
MTALPARPWGTTGLTTLVALAVVAGYSLLPRGGRLTHMDFLADDATVLELCNPLNPAVLPVQTGSLPVTMSFSPVGPVAPGGTETVAFALTTISGRSVAPEDLSLVDGQRIRLILTDEKGRVLRTDALPSDRWGFTFIPGGPGPFHVDADFTPVSTGKPLRASANLYVR